MQIVESCVITLPRIQYLKNSLDKTQDSSVGNSVVFNEGDKVIVKLGYNGKNTRRFEGFIKRINKNERLELECEGYNYQLPKSFSKSYANTTVKELLNDLIKGTDIKIDSNSVDAKLTNVRFKNSTGMKVLEWLQKEIHLAVYFYFDTLYVGTLYGRKRGRKKLRIGWNVVDEKDFKQRRTDENVLIQLVDKDSKGTVKRTKSDEKKYSQTKEVKIRSGLDAALKKAIANDLQSRENYRGYEGSLLCFLVPDIEKSDVVEIIDKRFPERSGDFFAETIEGSFDSNGGRQKVTLNYYGYAN